MLVCELLEDDQSRVNVGGSAQASFARVFKKKFPNSRVISISPRSSQAADIIVKHNGKKLQFEVKARTGPERTNVVYDKSLRRGAHDPILDAFARSFGKERTFSELIDSYRKKDSRIGFPGDLGVVSSGKIPREFNSTDPTFLSQLRQAVIRRLQANGDNYFAIHDLSTGITSVYFTGLGDNVLGAKPYPKLSSVQIDTYGGGYKGGMRVGIKAVIAASSKTIAL